MKHIKIFSIQLIIICFGSILYAQSPANDPNWQLNTGLSDEFNGTSLDVTKWKALTIYDNSWGGSTAFDPANVIISGGVCSLKVENIQYGFPKGIKTAGIWSNNFNYSYGYFEIFAQLPGFIDGSGVSHGDRFWPAFWTYYQGFSGGCLIKHDEIDILEPSGDPDQYGDAKTNVCGWHDETTNTSICTPPSGCSYCGYKVGQAFMKSATPLCSGYHKFAVEWNTNKIIFYFDDIPFYESHDSPSLIMNPQRVVIDQQIQADINFYPGTPFPQYMNTDYFRYYQLNKDCSTNTTILTNTNLASYVFSVKSNITFGNGSNSVSLNSGDVKYFRAVNSITINGDFTVPLGAEVGLLPTACN